MNRPASSVTTPSGNAREVSAPMPRSRDVSNRQASSLPGRRIYVALLLLLLSVNAAAFWYDSIAKAAAPYQLDYGEGIVLYQATKIGQLDEAYKTIDEYPFIVFHYPPLYHAATRLTGAFGASLLMAGRLVSMASGFLIQVIIGLLVFLSCPRKLKPGPRIAAAIFAGLSVSLLDAMRWTRFARVDMLALLLSFAGVALFAISSRRKVGQYLAFALLVAALFTKQTMLAAPLTCITVALIADWKRAARLCLFATVLGSTVLLGLAWATHGQVLKHLFLYNQNSFTLLRLLHGISDNFKTIVPLVALAATAAFSILVDALKTPRGKRLQRVRAWLEHSPYRRSITVCSILLFYAITVSLTYGKTGSNYNYFLEWNMISCALAGLVLYRALASWRALRFWSPGPVLLLLTPILFGLEGVPTSAVRLLPQLDRQSIAENAERLASHEAALKLVQETSGPVYSEDMLLLVEAGKEVPAEPSIVTELAGKGFWNENLLISMIDGHRFPLIIVEDLSNRQRFTTAVAGAITRAYAPTKKIGIYQVLEPRDQ
ncbi:MAG TPA: hypothetical protein VFY29_04685 [Terriglobia bacterium]|nr:hypothetical protein [Terriglobia bacterium]